MRGEDKFCALLNKQPQSRQSLNDARGIGDDHLAILFFERHVVIDPHEHAFASNVEISDRQLWHKLSPQIGAQSIAGGCFESKSF